MKRLPVHYFTRVVSGKVFDDRPLHLEHIVEQRFNAISLTRCSQCQHECSLSYAATFHWGNSEYCTLVHSICTPCLNRVCANQYSRIRVKVSDATFDYLNPTLLEHIINGSVSLIQDTTAPPPPSPVVVSSTLSTKSVQEASISLSSVQPITTVPVSASTHVVEQMVTKRKRSEEQESSDVLQSIKKVRQDEEIIMFQMVSAHLPSQRQRYNLALDATFEPKMTLYVYTKNSAATHVDRELARMATYPVGFQFALQSLIRGDMDDFSPWFEHSGTTTTTRKDMGSWTVQQVGPSIALCRVPCAQYLVGICDPVVDDYLWRLKIHRT